MRRLAFAAVCGTLVLAACGDQNTSPTEPSASPPAATFGNTCSHGRYPLRDIAPLIPPVFATRAFRAEALVRVGAIALLWDFCQDRLARQAALKTIAWINLRAINNTSPAAVALKDAILAGFGGASTSPDDYVAGVYIPGTTMVFTTPSGRATLELRPGAFTLPTLITIRRLSDDFRLSGFPEDQQDSPFWDYDATNSSTDNTVETHTLATPGTATMAFCFRFEGEGQVSYPYPGAQIGHNPVGGGFEIVEEVAVPDNLQDELSCPAFSDLRLGSLGRGLPGFGRYLGSVAKNLFLPAPLLAATVGPRGPIAGLPINLSPFGIVLPTAGDLEFTPDGDPGSPFQREFGNGATLSWYPAGCEIECSTRYPTVRLVDGEGLGVEGEQITVTLQPADEGPGGDFGEGDTQQVITSSDEGEEGRGYATFFDLNVFLRETEDGLFRLVFSAPGVTPLESGVFRVFSTSEP